MLMYQSWKYPHSRTNISRAFITTQQALQGQESGSQFHTSFPARSCHSWLVIAGGGNKSQLAHRKVRAEGGKGRDHGRKGQHVFTHRNCMAVNLPGHWIKRCLRPSPWEFTQHSPAAFAGVDYLHDFPSLPERQTQAHRLHLSVLKLHYTE